MENVFRDTKWRNTKFQIIVKKCFESPYSDKVELEVELFTWEKLDRVDDIKKEFGI